LARTTLHTLSVRAILKKEVINKVHCLDDSSLNLLLVIFGCLLFFSITGCHYGGANPSPESSSLPCWVHSPVHENTVGAVGIVRADTQTREKALKWGKRKAARMLVPYCEAGEEELSKVSQLGFQEGERTQFGECRLGFADWFRKGAYLYVYAVSGESPDEAWLNKAGCERGCSLSACEPEWICQPMGKEHAGFLGVSAISSSRAQQYRLAFANAVEQMSIMYGVTVDAEYFSVMGASGSRVRRMAYKDNNRLLLPEKDYLVGSRSRPVVADTCFINNRLYARVLNFALPSLGNMPPKKWRTRPSQGNRPGVVGSAGPTASGRLSDQFRLAMKRGLVQLAKAKEIKVKGITCVRRTQSKRLILDIQHQSTHTTVIGEVAGLYLQKVPLGHRLYLWIREPETQSNASKQ